jgi:hypothetical protein
MIGHASSPTLGPRSATALVMEAVRIDPCPTSMLTCDVVAPDFMSTILPMSWLRALIFVVVSGREYGDLRFGAPAKVVPHGAKWQLAARAQYLAYVRLALQESHMRRSRDWRYG